MYCHYIGWCIGKCPLYRGVLYSECPLSEVPLYSSQGWAPECPLGSILYVYFVLVCCMVSGLGLLLASVLCICISMYLDYRMNCWQLIFTR